MPVAEHDLLNILYALKGTIEDHLSHVSNGRRDSLKKAHAQTERALRIVKRLGYISGPAGKISPESLRSKVSVREAWQIALRLLGDQRALDYIEMVERIPDGFPLIRCQRDDFKEILFHLAKNAVQAMSPVCGEGNVRAHKLILRAQIGFSSKEEPIALISISDTGAGIPKSVLARLFEPFFTTKPEGEGNGLGLYVVKSLVAKNSGSIAASSFPGFGTTFTLQFPLVSEPSRSD